MSVLPLVYVDFRDGGDVENEVAMWRAEDLRKAVSWREVSGI